MQPDELAELGWDGPIISAVTGQGVRELVGQLARTGARGPSGEPVGRGRRHHPARGRGRPRSSDSATHEFRLLGREVERVVALNDVTTPEALSYIDYRSKRLGVPKMLARAGARDGDVVWIAEFSFEYQPEA